MNWLPLIIIFCAGIVFGLILSSLSRLIKSEGLNNFFEAVARIAGAPFFLLGRLFRRKQPDAPGDREQIAAAGKKVDPREQQISDSAQTLRSILLSLATVIQRTDKAASDSSQTLGDVRNTIDKMRLPADLSEVHDLLMKEIDRMISSDANLRGELARSREILADQRRQIEELRTAVRIDGLTQLANRAYFDEKLTEMLKLRERYNEPFSVLMIDVDNFKSVNDNHGHLAGDRVLKGVAFKIKAALRDSDFLARFGGDEFALILIKAGAKSATDVAWKLCNALRESRFLLDGKEFKVTLSIGGAEALPGETADSLLKRADEALYRVKELGRNNIYVAEPPLPAESLPKERP